VTGWVWLDAQLALAIHNRALMLYGGSGGLRDERLLQAALARPQQIAAYAEIADEFVLAAAYTAGMVKNHPFTDGHKRTGFVLGVLFLELNGKRFTAREEDAAAAVIALAAGAWDEAAYAAFLRENVTDA